VGSVSVSGGVLQVVGNGSWTNYAYRPGTGSAGEVIRFAFKTTDVNTSTPLYLQSGTFNTSTYRRWGVYVMGGVLQREYYQGTTRSVKSLMGVSANTWYEVALRLNGMGGFQVMAWKRGEAAVWGADSVQFASGWEGLSWTYVAQAYNGTLQVDDYQEQAGGAIGQRTGMVDGSGSTAWEYDLAGRLAKETRAVSGQGSFVTQWGYFNTGQMAWMQYPGGNAGQAGEKLTYSYYPQGAPKTLWSDLGTPANTADDYYYLQQAGYDAAGRTVRLWLGGTYLANLPTVQNGYTYFDWITPNGAGRLKRITAGTVNDANNLLDLRYYSGTNTPAYDAFGNLLNIYRYNTSDVLLETQTFGYDLLDRLTSAAATGGAGYSESYSYDASTGSLASKTGVGSYAYHAPRQGTCTAGTNAAIPHAAQTAGANAYTYDCNGNMLTRPGQALTFDAENRLVEVNRTLKPTRTEASFTYDGDGTRVKSVVGSTTTVFIGEYLEWTGSTSTMKLHYYAGGRRIALRSAGTLLWLTGDHLGSATLTADASGGSAVTQLYKAWGEIRTGSLNALATRYTFTGQAVEDSIGLMFYHARWYDPLLGRFVSADTIVPGAFDPLAYDRYAYVRSNPLRYVDPSGHKACIEFDENGKCIQDPDWHPRQVPFFTRSPVNSEDIDFIQWFGGTEAAYNDHLVYLKDKRSSWNYDGYCQGYHCGLDYGADWGTPVYAGVYGEVVSTDFTKDGGYFIIVKVRDHIIKYQSLDGNFRVDFGDMVTPDTILAGVGNHKMDPNGNNNHLHLEVRYSSSGHNAWKDRIANPLLFMSGTLYAELQNKVAASPWENVFFHPPADNDPLKQVSPIVRGGTVLWP
jgi:RHS repeat-associated protein